MFTDSVELSNTTDRDAELFFNTEQLGLSGEQDELLRNLMLTISMDGQELYSGDLKAEDMGGAVSWELMLPDRLAHWISRFLYRKPGQRIRFKGCGCTLGIHG